MGRSNERYDSEDKVELLVRSFETATISRDAWTHAEHLVVALYYLTHRSYDEAYVKMRSGIMKLLVNGFGVNLDAEMPYHDTISVFWLRAVAAFSGERVAVSSGEGTTELIARYDKHLPLEYYSREVLFSDDARARFVEPDLKKFNFSE